MCGLLTFLRRPLSDLAVSRPSCDIIDVPFDLKTRAYFCTGHNVLKVDKIW